MTERHGALVASTRSRMSVEEGEVRAVIGPNGAGKTTLFQLVTGVVKPTAGGAIFDGPHDRRPGKPPDLPAAASRTFQITALFPEMTARENAGWRPRPAIRDAGSRSAAPRSSRRPKGGRCSAGAARPRRIADRPARCSSPRRPAPARGRHGAGAAAAGAAARRADAGLSVEETGQAVETLAAS